VVVRLIESGAAGFVEFGGTWLVAGVRVDQIVERKCVSLASRYV
jgi:hypothetical protein